MNSRAWFFLIALAPSAAGAAATCSFSSTPGMSFGAYNDSSAADTDSTTSIVVDCFRNAGPASADVTLQLGPSAGSGALTPRRMSSGSNRLDYNLYRDAGRSQVWGQTPGVDAVTITINGIPNNGSRSGTFVIYGRVPALQNVPAGAYSDSVQMTVSP